MPKNENNIRGYRANLIITDELFSDFSDRVLRPIEIKR
jgi:hypothetical protein